VAAVERDDFTAGRARHGRGPQDDADGASGAGFLVGKLQRSNPWRLVVGAARQQRVLLLLLLLLPSRNPEIELCFAGKLFRAFHIQHSL
jgi:hypothetical protein